MKTAVVGKVTGSPNPPQTLMLSSEILGEGRSTFNCLMTQIKEDYTLTYDPSLLQTAPHNAPIRRCDEVKAARDLVLCCWIPD